MARTDLGLHFETIATICKLSYAFGDAASGGVTQGCSPDGARGRSHPCSNFWLSLPSHAKLFNIFLKFFYHAVDWQTYFTICSQCQGRTDGGNTPFQVGSYGGKLAKFQLSVGKSVPFYRHTP